MPPRRAAPWLGKLFEVVFASVVAGQRALALLLAGSPGPRASREGRTFTLREPWSPLPSPKFPNRNTYPLGPWSHALHQLLVAVLVLAVFAVRLVGQSTLRAVREVRVSFVRGAGVALAKLSHVVVDAWQDLDQVRISQS